MLYFIWKKVNFFVNVIMVWQRTESQRISSSEVYPKRFPKESIRALHLVQRFKPSQEGNLPMSSRIMVKRITQVSLTAGFGMRPGVSSPLWPSNHKYSNIFETYTTCLTIEPANERLVTTGWTRRRSFVLTP